MSDEINYKNNPLNGVGLKKLLIEIVDHYSFEILFAYLNINCFKTNPGIDSSVKFLKKTNWAREKVEAFYLYEFKSLPKATGKQLSLSPRDRVVPDDQTPGEPAGLNLDDAERLRLEREKKAAEWSRNGGHSQGGSSKRFNAQRSKQSNNHDNKSSWKSDRESSNSSSDSAESNIDPWAKWKSKPK